uniref:DEAD/DEAH box helicase n=1 Tax=Anisakis simplex TaxID=6269 RepID=A0A0M3JXZ9_ANISI
LIADPKSRLAEWFKPGTVKPLATDKGERFVPSLALPSKPDDLAKLVGECEALNLSELKELAIDVLQKYQRTEEQHYVTSYVQIALRDLEAWHFEKEQGKQNSVATKKKAAGTPQEENYPQQPTYDEWDNM